MGVAAAFCFAADHHERYADFFAPDGSLRGPGYSDDEAVGLPPELVRPGITVAGAATAPDGREPDMTTRTRASGPRRPARRRCPAGRRFQPDDGRRPGPVGDPRHLPHQRQGARRGTRRRRRRDRRGRQPRRGRGGRRIAAEQRDPDRPRLVRGAPRRPGRRGRLHLAAERAPPPLDAARARGRQARPVREAVLTRAPGEVDARVGPRRVARPPADGSVHVAPQPPDPAVPRAAARRSASSRRSARRSASSSTTRTTSGCRPALDGRLADGRRLLLRERRRGCSPGRSPTACTASRPSTANGIDTRFAGTLHFPSGIVATFVTGFTTEHAGLEAIGSQGVVRADDPWHVRSGVIQHDDRARGGRHDERLPPRAREPVGGDPRPGQPLLGRADALGQARTSPRCTNRPAQDAGHARPDGPSPAVV